VSDDDVQRPDGDPRDRPADPAGTRPKVDPASLLPAPRERQWLEPAPGAAPVVAAPIAPEPPAAETGRPHLERFQFVLGALLACAVAAVAAFVIIAAGDGKGTVRPEPAWSAWKPTAGGVLATEQIADHVGAAYKTATGDQLTIVTGGLPELGGLGAGGAPLPLDIVVKLPAAQGGVAQRLGGVGVMYRLCGLSSDKDCGIPGEPSEQRWLLVQREAVELALYTFRYLDEVDNVVVVTPPTRPPPGATPTASDTKSAGTRALLFQRGDVAQQLRAPLSASLAVSPPRPDEVDGTPDILLVKQITSRRVFSFQFEPANADNSAFMVLQPG
jgi:hypothetical protein